MAKGKKATRQGKVKVDKTKCVGCSYCKLNCPSFAMVVDDALASPTSTCVLCGICPWVCPVNAITIEQ